jgi:hypothetical protein
MEMREEKNKTEEDNKELGKKQTEREVKKEWKNMETEN